MLRVQNIALSVGSIFCGAYEVLSELGEGSFGRVYKARQLSTGQNVAIKTLRFRQGDTDADIHNQIERFRREMRLCAELSHPNLVRLIDSGETRDGILYAVFEFVPGETLRQVLTAEGKLGFSETLHLMTQVLDALSCAHAHGIVHRDLKPENIMVTKTGARRNALVLDLGLGGFAPEAQGRHLPRLTATHEIMGTPCYAAPEQLRGEPPSTRSDLYSWGLIFLECLSGELAVSGASGQEVILKQLGTDPVPIPPRLRHQRLGRVLATVTAKRVEQRDVTIEDVFETLESVAPQELQAPPAGALVEPLTDGERRQLTVVCCRLDLRSLSGEPPELEEVDQLLHAQHGRIAEHVSRNGGELASVLGDRLLLVFGYPEAREDDARRAARTALQLVADIERENARLASECQLRLDLRMGMHTGLVIVRAHTHGGHPAAFDVIGPTTELATRLEELAKPGEILATLETVRLLRNEIGSEPAAHYRADERAAEITVLRLTARQPTMGRQEAPALVRETPLVGRAQELNQLLEGWAQTQAGKGGAVLIIGEPGIGKSRLVRELRQQVGRGWVECRCAAENQHSPLRPIADLLQSVEEPLESLLARYGMSEALPLFATLISRPVDGSHVPLQLSPERQKELTLNAILTLLVKMAGERPRVFVFEDLYWADPTTLELVGQLVQEVGAARLLEAEMAAPLYLVLTVRPEFTPPWPLQDVRLIQLARLNREEVERMIEAGLTQNQAVPRAVLDQVIERADGVPLFVEEVTRMLIESGMLSASAALTAKGPGVAIPTTLRELLTARLDALSPGARDAIQLAAVLGREFRYELLSAVATRSEPALRHDLNELAKAGLVYRRHSRRSESYVFKHALLRDAAYESLLRLRRQRLHQRVASVLQERFPDMEKNRPETVALHLEKGAQLLAAAEYWHRAGDRAIKRAAYVEAIHQLERGLGLLQSMSGSPQRTRLELELLTTLGTGLLMTKGYAAEEVERTFAQASNLSHQLDEDIPLKVLYGIWGVQIARGDRLAVDKLVPAFQRLAARAEDPVAMLTAHAALGVNAFWRGNFTEAEEHLAHGRELYLTEACERFARELGYDAGLYSHAYGMFTLWQLGYPDRAEALRCELLATAERSGNPYSLALALGFGSSLAYDRGDTAPALEMSERLSALAAEQHFYLWSADAACSRGGALLQRGDTEEAIALIQQGVGLYAAIGALPSYAYYLSYLAAAYLRAGRPSDGLAVVEEGLSLCETLVARFHEPEFLRLKGSLLALQGECAGTEECFRRALEVAQQRRALSYELRAAISLGRLLAARGNCGEARSLVGGVYERFTEGFATKDLREAQAVLAKLR